MIMLVKGDLFQASITKEQHIPNIIINKVNKGAVTASYL